MCRTHPQTKRTKNLNLNLNLLKMVLGIYKIHQYSGFKRANLRLLLTDGNSLEGKKMTFQDRISGKCFQLFVPSGIVIMFSRSGGGVLILESTWYHGMIDAEGFSTIN